MYGWENKNLYIYTQEQRYGKVSNTHTYTHNHVYSPRHQIIFIQYQSKKMICLFVNPNN